MADPKYIKHVIPVSPQIAEGLARVRKQLFDQLGFQPSLAETVAYLVNFHEKHEQDPEQLPLV